MRAQNLTYILLISLLLAACNRYAPVETDLITPIGPGNIAAPTLAPVRTYLPPTRAPDAAIASPTPDKEVVLLPTFTPLPPGALNIAATEDTQVKYTVQSGDFLGKIAQNYGISIEELAEANQLNIYTAVIYPGDVLIIPIAPDQAPLAMVTQQAASSDYFKIIPDSELVYSPLGTLLNIEAYIRQQGGHLAYYKQEVDGDTLDGAQIVRRVAENYSVNPRLLLAVLEYRSQWVTNPNPAQSTLDTPIKYIDDTRVGLYRQLAWTADKLNEGFYRWREEKVNTWQLADGSLILPQPGINAGTAGVQNLFAKISGQAAWRLDTGPNGLYATYSKMFGYPFDWAIEPLLPDNLSQPVFNLPFESGDVWTFTGGPHGGWDSGSAWAGLDFAPPGEPQGCVLSQAWVTAVTDGLIVRSENGAVIQDLDADGLEQTGWTILYLHIDRQDRVQAGTFVRAGERIGRPSCEGGFSNATHLHIARRYNGLWITADEPGLNFSMDGWVVQGDNREYNGFLSKGNITLQAWETVGPINQIQRP